MRSSLQLLFAVFMSFSAVMPYVIADAVDHTPQSFISEAAPLATTNTIMLDGMVVPDIGTLPASLPIPKTNPNPNQTAKVELGKQLYFDSRLSKNNIVSCAYCHIPGAGFADPHPTSAGIDDLLGGRHAPTIFNVAFNPFQFWDGRVEALEEQAVVPIQNPIEMAETPEHLAAKLESVKGYREQFRSVFGAGVSLQRIAEAIASYERTIISTNSLFDKYVLGQTTAMNESAIRGMGLFKRKARCILCHNGPNFTDNRFHNLGVPQVGPQKEDLGRYYVTKQGRDRGRSRRRRYAAYWRRRHTCTMAPF